MIHLKRSVAATCSFSLDKFDENGIVESLEPFANTVLNDGIFSLYTDSLKTMTSFINIGGDNTPTVVTQHGLVDHLFVTNNVISEKAEFLSTPSSHLKVTKIFRFDIGTCTGIFKEIALSKLSDSAYFNRQLLKNGLGDPISVEVKVDQGLLLTAEIKIFLDPNISMVGEVLKLDLKTPTGGSFTFSCNGQTSTPVTFEQFSVGPVEMLEAVKEMVDPDLVVGIGGNLTDGFIISFLPLAGQTGLSVIPTALVGNVSAPVVSIITPNTKLPISFNLNDIDLGTSVSMTMNRSFPLSTSNSVWGMNELTNPLYTAALQDWTYEINGQAPSSVQKTPPTETLPEVTDICTWLPGRISEEVSFSFHSILVKLGGKSIYEYRFVDPITISNTEEMKFTFKRGWGRWTDINP